ncbi:FecR family protein [Prevotella merdae]|uniref:FecR family protein n=1 Tax=Prevotella merdae TaxID=2079531 RepID=UPI003F80925E
MQPNSTKYTESTPKDDALRRLWNQDVSDISESEMSDALAIFRNRRTAYNSAKRRKVRVLSIMKYAALFIAPIITAFVAWNYSAQYYADDNALVELYVPDGKIDSVVLSDNTKLIVNAGTSVIYPARFNKHNYNRNVYVNGNCHFAVAKDPLHPFVVNMGNLKVKVLGTHFSVNSYNEEDSIYVTLEEGLVEAFDNRQSVLLRPNEQLVYCRSNGSMRKHRVDALTIGSWVNGNITFTAQSLGQILKTIERHYNVRFDVSKDIDLNRRYTMNFRKGEPIDCVLKVLSMTSGNIQYVRKYNIIKLY